MALKTIPFDMVESLDSEEVIAEYLKQVFADGDSDEIKRALGYAAKARVMLALPVAEHG